MFHTCCQFAGPIWDWFAPSAVYQHQSPLTFSVNWLTPVTSLLTPLPTLSLLAVQLSLHRQLIFQYQQPPTRPYLLRRSEASWFIPDVKAGIFPINSPRPEAHWLLPASNLMICITYWPTPAANLSAPFVKSTAIRLKLLLHMIFYLSPQLADPDWWFPSAGKPLTGLI